MKKKKKNAGKLFTGNYSVQSFFTYTQFSSASVECQEYSIVYTLVIVYLECSWRGDRYVLSVSPNGCGVEGGTRITILGKGKFLL